MSSRLLALHMGDALAWVATNGYRGQSYNGQGKGVHLALLHLVGAVAEWCNLPACNPVSWGSIPSRVISIG